MGWLGWTVFVVGVLVLIGVIVVIAKASITVGVAAVDRAAHALGADSPPGFDPDHLRDGTPVPALYIDRAEALHRQGRDDEALAVLKDGMDDYDRRGQPGMYEVLAQAFLTLDQGMRLQAVQARILAALDGHPGGIKQTDLYPALRDAVESDEELRLAFWHLAENGRITREKAGRTYRVSLPEP